MWKKFETSFSSFKSTWDLLKRGDSYVGKSEFLTMVGKSDHPLKLKFFLEFLKNLIRKLSDLSEYLFLKIFKLFIF